MSSPRATRLSEPGSAGFANNADASLDPWNHGPGSGDTQPAPDTALVHTWWGHHVVASWSVHANAAVNTDFDPRGGVNKRGPGCDECARWGRSLTCLMAPPFPSIMSHGGPGAGKETSSGFPGLCAQFTGRRLGL